MTGTKQPTCYISLQVMGSGNQAIQLDRLCFSWNDLVLTNPWCNGHLYRAGHNDYNQHFGGNPGSLWHYCCSLAATFHLPRKLGRGLHLSFLTVISRPLSVHDIPIPGHLFWEATQALNLLLVRQGGWSLLEGLFLRWTWMPTLHQWLKQHYCQADLPAASLKGLRWWVFSTADGRSRVQIRLNQSTSINLSPKKRIKFWEKSDFLPCKKWYCQSDQRQQPQKQ